EAADSTCRHWLTCIPRPPFFSGTATDKGVMAIISFKNSGGKPRVKLILLKSYSVLNNVDKRSLKEEINCSKSAMLVDCFKLLSISIFIVFKCFTFDNVAGHSMKNTLKRL